jgi:hypothetical protein
MNHVASDLVKLFLHQLSSFECPITPRISASARLLGTSYDITNQSGNACTATACTATEFNTVAYSKYTYSLKNYTAMNHVASDLVKLFLHQLSSFECPITPRISASARLLGTSYDITNQSGNACTATANCEWALSSDSNCSVSWSLVYAE